ncbi:hypothetical protein L248_3119 [Schleiferilactobacillus shenzhenensis LY-73]|uniref:Uncharacterized protein n=2 Tax=Schleiferilactobacillus shenzhenensis TaxID=1231337 RepID=U4TU43_9LACO|nr:hypothetical protein L248_3119 [Schleiferilactobacillus shenzhenensis LY-73]
MDEMITRSQPSKTASTSDRVLAQANYRKISQVLGKKHYAEVNRLILKELHDVPNDPIAQNIVFSIPFTGSFGVHNIKVDIAKVYQCLVARDVQHTPFVSERSDAVNMLGHTLGTHDFDGHGPTLLLYCLLAALAVLFGLYFTLDYQRNTSTFVNTLPTSRFGYRVRQTILLVILLNIAVLGPIIMITLLVSLLPDHALGSLVYPITLFPAKGTVLIPLWQYFILWWLVVNLWALFLAGGALLFSLVSRNPIVNVFGLLLVVFAEPLQLLRLLPPTARLFLPPSYTAVPQMFFQLNQFESIPVAQWYATFMLWVLSLWLLIGVVMKLQERPRRPAPKQPAD